MGRVAPSPPGGGPRTRAVLVGVAAFLTGLTAGGLIPARGSADHSVANSSDAPTRTVEVDGGAVDTGPTHTTNGAPSGFAHSEAGAVAASAAFVATGQELLDMDPLAAEEAIREMAASASADDQVKDLLAKLASARTALGRGTGPIIYRQSVVAWRVEAYAPERARVAIWNVSVLSRDGVAPPQAGWAISTFDLVWERNDWRIWAETIAPGPAPILDDSTAPATSAQLDAALRGFADFGSEP